MAVCDELVLSVYSMLCVQLCVSLCNSELCTSEPLVVLQLCNSPI